MNQIKMPQLIEDLCNIEQKYESLVWLARKSSGQMKFPEVFDAIEKIASMHEEEVAALIHPDSGDWQHGFNSGMLAATRFVQDYISRGPKAAAESFPNLNS